MSTSTSPTTETGHLLNDDESVSDSNENNNNNQTKNKIELNLLEDIHDPNDYINKDESKTNSTESQRVQAIRNRISQRDVNLRIQSYLKESDENCKESATLIAIVLLGLIVTGSVVGFLQLGRSDVHVVHKGSHAESTHVHGQAVPELEQWFGAKLDEIESEVSKSSLPYVETLGIQPLYRNFLLQTVYEYSFQNAIPISNTAVFSHVSMTYGGPWDVPPAPEDVPVVEDIRRRLLKPITHTMPMTRHNLLAHEGSSSGTRSLLKKLEVTDSQDNDDIPVVSITEAVEHRFTFPANGKSYDNDINQWHCYLFEFANANTFENGFSFRVSTKFVHFDMESGYDFVRLYINSQYSGQSFTGRFQKSEEIVYRINHDYLDEWQQNDIPSFELCFNIITDESNRNTGFSAVTRIDYENPGVVQWKRNVCHTASPNWRNPKRWNGDCGIGIQTSTITQCNGKDDSLDTGVCTLKEVETDYCIKANCSDVDNSKVSFSDNAKLKYHYNGIHRIDPIFSNPFQIQRSTNVQFDIERIIQGLLKFQIRIEKQYKDFDLRILTQAVAQHPYMVDSQLRLGMKLARSLILGDTFTVAFTGSSNTAGHDNMFMSSYPLQLQSLLRPLWKRIGYKGAAFEVKNRAVGGSLGTDQMTWCVPQLTDGLADKIDVIFWESQMNDAGSQVSRAHTMENHIRNSLSMQGGTYNNNKPNRPLWHAMMAGSHGESPTKFDTKPKLYAGWSDLLELYSHEYGAGIVQFVPSNGMNPIKSKVKAFSDEQCYVTWHPGPKGHRIYAEMIAYFYVKSALVVLNDIKPTILDLDVDGNPIIEILDLLQDAPYKTHLPPWNNDQPIKCKPICSDAQHQSCITSLNPKDMTFKLESFVVDAADWQYKDVAGNPQPITKMVGGQASIDSKYGYFGTRSSGEIKIKIKIVGNGFLLIEKPYADWGKLNDVLKSMHKWFHVRIISSDQGGNDDKHKREMKCIKDKHLWNSDVIQFGCVLHFEQLGKYVIGITVDTEEVIPLLVFATY